MSFKETRVHEATKMFKLKGDIVGNKKNQQEPTAVKDPITGHTVTDPKEIKEIVINYVDKLLTNRLPNPGFEIDLQVKSKLHKRRMKEVKENDIEHLTPLMFTKSLKELSQKKGVKYEFLSKRGSELKRAL